MKYLLWPDSRWLILKLFIVVLILIFWPVSFFLNNNLNTFVLYFILNIFLLISWWLFKTGKTYWVLPLLAVGLVDPKLIIFPFVVIILKIILVKKDKFDFLSLLISFAIIILGYKTFITNSVFDFDYQIQQLILRNTYLYPKVWLARLFQNKITGIYISKFEFNFFALVDPNNYFFHFHPREITDINQNLHKFPSLVFPFFFFGLFTLTRNMSFKFIIIILTALILNLSLLKVFDINDILLYFPLSLIILLGFNIFTERVDLKRGIWLFIVLLFGIAEFLNILVGRPL